jgi:putative SOS response-associated peptidase YedK
MFFAGLYDTVEYLSPVESKFQPREGDDREPYPTGNPIPLSTYTILTTVPAKDISWLHDRMPCILSDWDDIERWLDLGKVKGWEDGKEGTGSLLKGTPGLDW